MMSRDQNPPLLRVFVKKTNNFLAEKSGVEVKIHLYSAFSLRKQIIQAEKLGVEVKIH